jgi:thiol-disulfide isomerase/thioredoxin
MGKFLAGVLFAAAVAHAALIPEVRQAIAADDFAAAERRIAAYRQQNGVTAEMIEALSWLGRGAQARQRWDRAHAYAAETRKLALDMLKRRPLDADRHLPIALGASIEVQAHVLAGRGARSEAVAFLLEELDRWRAASIRTRIQKNVHLLSLEGKEPPPVTAKEWLGPRPEPLKSYRGQAVLLFFWAHWCGDCKQQAPVLARLLDAYGPKGLVIIGPTQRYGYVARGQEAAPDEELRYIEQVRRGFYRSLPAMSVPVSEETFKVYGSSTTPTLVLIDRAGLVRLYHPGKMSFEDLAPHVAAALGIPRS